MRILLVSDTYRPVVSGVVAVIDGIATHLRDIGHDVAIVAPTPEKDQEDLPFPLFSVPSIPNPWRTGGRLSVATERKVRQIFTTWEPDVIHVHTPGSLGMAAIRSASRLKLPVVATHHFSRAFLRSYFPDQVWATGAPELALATYLTTLYRSCTVVTCPTATAHQDILDLGVRVPIVVLPSGLAEEWFTADEKRNAGADNWEVLSVGRLDHDKDIPTLLTCFEKLLEEPRVHISIVGSGKELPMLEQWVKEKMAEKQVTLYGMLSPGSPELRNLYAQAALFVTSSPIETQGLAVLEAQAQGLPVVAVRAGALPEVIDEGKTGLLVPEGDGLALAEATLRLLSNSEIRQEFSIAARKKATAYRWKILIKDYLALYQEACDKVSGPVETSIVEPATEK